jgi:hypothetical protein
VFSTFLHLAADSALYKVAGPVSQNILIGDISLLIRAPKEKKTFKSDAESTPYTQGHSETSAENPTYIEDSERKRQQIEVTLSRLMG